tara:strand:+ start:827 stop:1411 length:585 start_codon:yes stop_codon:yes gene_type:complete
MSSPDAVRRLLEGEIDPIEIEGDANLYSMAERIYGSEVLEEMGVTPPEVDDLEEQTGLGLIPSDITLPDFMPNIPTLKSEKVGRGKIRLMTLFSGFMGLIGTAINVLIGGGYVLCSVGLADYPHICKPSNGNYKLVIEEGYTWERLHTPDAWTQPLDYSIADVVLLATFLIMTIFGLFSRKKSIHSSHEASLES